jgi:hypothetical protein
MVSPATFATTVIPPSGENVAHPDSASAKSSTAKQAGLDRSLRIDDWFSESSKLRIIVRSYWPDFDEGAARSFCSRHAVGLVGRRLV